MLSILVLAVAAAVWFLALLPLAVSRGKAWVLHEQRTHRLHPSTDPGSHRFAA